MNSAIVRSPSRNFADGITNSGLSAPNYELAVEQHEAYCQTLESLNFTLIRLSTDERYPDSTFVEDTAVLTERGAVITRPGALSRQPEVNEIKRSLDQFYSVVKTIEPPGTLDGGDVCQVEDHFFVGVSDRTNEHGANQLGKILNAFGYTSTMVDIRHLSPRLLHLKSGLAYLGRNKLVVDAGLSEREDFKKFEVITPEADESYAANCLAFDNTIVIAAGYPGFESQVKKAGFGTVSLDMSEFQKMDGGLSCLSLRF